MGDGENFEFEFEFLTNLEEFGNKIIKAHIMVQGEDCFAKWIAE